MLRLMRRPTRVLCAVLAPNPGEPTAEVRLGIRGIFVGVFLGKQESQTRSMLADHAKMANSPSLRRRRGRPCHLQDSPRRLCCLRHLSKRSMLSRRSSVAIRRIRMVWLVGLERSTRLRIACWYLRVVRVALLRDRLRRCSCPPRRPATSLHQRDWPSSKPLAPLGQRAVVHLGVVEPRLPRRLLRKSLHSPPDVRWRSPGSLDGSSLMRQRARFPEVSAYYQGGSVSREWHTVEAATSR